MTATDNQPNRLERRKARTRAALIGSAQSFIAEGRFDVPILDITQVADVGLGSFYNHFADRDELFQAALVEALDSLGSVFDDLTEDLDDPAEVFARSFRLFGRQCRRQPTLSKVLINNWSSILVVEDKGLAPRARRDIAAGMRTGRFTVSDLDLTMTIITGAAIFLGRLLHDEPDRDADAAVDSVAADLLRLLGVPAGEALDVCGRPLPDVDVVARE